MSLINQMLKDLENRRGEKAAASARPLPGSKKPTRAVWPWLLSIVLGIAVIVLAAMLWSGSVANTNKIVQTPDTISPADTVTSPAEQHSAPVVDSGLNTENPHPAEGIHRAAVIEPKPDAEIENSASTLKIPAAEPAKFETALAPEKDRQPEGVTTTVTALETPAVAPTPAMDIRPHARSAEEIARAQFQEGMTAAHQSRWALASELLAQALEVLPQEDGARQTLYIALRRQNRLAEAEALLVNALTEASQPSRFAKLYARTLSERGKFGEAVTVLSLAPPPVTQDSEFHALKGALAQQAGEYAIALESYEALVQHYPDNGGWLAGLGVSRDQTGDIPGALDAYQQALRAGGLPPTVNQYVSQRLQQLRAAEGE